MSISIHTISTSVHIPMCMCIEDIKVATEGDAELQMLKRYITKRWPLIKVGVESGLEKYWHIRHELTETFFIAMKGK